ncbi:hypothetical protein [Actinoplanes sp. N902-109]|uniref:hypothetical protein n=1 Tax=Actinoplanes sp. (strain N902-109) TaxID=649831 RepID=UPI0003295F32|nr:hypothetical protein [Actinoplanes sp. N902-109]AGL21706.1 hypothetical protein L083_8196 [Actinoplanes sp. N902-109]
MTGAEFSGVDIDLLADFVGGALDGTPDEARVARRIAEDPAWQDAFVELSAGVEAVAGALRSWGTEPEPMPDDVVARLDAALLAPPAPETPQLVAVPGGKPSSSRRRRLTWAVPIGVAAAAVAFAGVGLRQWNSDSPVKSDSAAGGSTVTTLAAPPAQQLESGIDYTRQSLGQAAASTLLGSAPPARINGQDQAGEGATAKAAPGDALARLRVPEALVACLTAIAGQNGVGQVAAQTVDYARFQGAPALIVHFTAANGTWVWAVGAACGLPGSGTDMLASVRVG